MAFVPLDPDRQLGYLLARAADQAGRLWLARLKSRNINPRQFSMLAWLAKDPGLSQGALARLVMITPQSASESLKALVDAGLVARGEVAPGRPARLHLTASGRSLLTKAYPLVERANQESFAALTASERTHLGALLRKLLRAPVPTL